MGGMKDALLGDNSYPEVTGRAGTRATAARAIEPKIGTLKSRALAVIRTAGEYGATPDEVATAMGETVLAVRPRVTELLKSEMIEEHPTRRRANTSGHSATAYVARGR